jgi:hypothetical protein
MNVVGAQGAGAMPYVIASVLIVVCIALPICAWVFLRYLAHVERMELIRHGHVPEATGSGLSSGPRGGSAQARIALRRGISVAFIGLVLLVGLSFIGWSNGHFIFGPWLLGGVIPLLAGLAQAISALVESRGARSARIGLRERWPSPARREYEQRQQEDRR